MGSVLDQSNVVCTRTHSTAAIHPLVSNGISISSPGLIDAGPFLLTGQCIVASYSQTFSTSTYRCFGKKQSSVLLRKSDEIRKSTTNTWSSEICLTFSYPLLPIPGAMSKEHQLVTFPRELCLGRPPGSLL
jgi:hypothetical protein